ncbi:hypothetical protein DM01DRAFT_1192968 [Hesseltinella vesiculosa]|uniref:Protein Lines N-terminal domain-containing protein n=1 Tax=Hesseltinella vesiculosa TaxID=101127 RepID=A0A1X2GS12_9FUNG|nr:hypothetical protein DM01DRAFT_1192968 [Hesseltinella vesiculosa]
MLKAWIQSTSLTHDPLDSYLQQKTCFDLVLSSPTKTLGPAFAILVTKVLDDPDACSFYLNICHCILKRGRHESDAPMTALLHAFLDRHDQLPLWSKEQLKYAHPLDLVPFLVWAIDIAKTVPLQQDQEAQDILDLLLTDEWLLHVFRLWRHDHITVVRKSMELILRLVPYVGQDLLILICEHVFGYVILCQKTLTPAQFDILTDYNRTDFFYQPLSQQTLVLDRECLSMVLQCVTKTLGRLVRLDSLPTSLTDMLDTAFLPMQETVLATSLDVMARITGSNDQVMIVLQLEVLMAHLWLEQHDHQPPHPSLAWAMERFNPHVLFSHFLILIGMKYELLVDLLMSNETEMLEFLVRYLKFLERHVYAFMKALGEVMAEEDEEDDPCQDVMDLLTQLLAVLQTDVFPYNAAVLSRRIQSVLACLQSSI